MQTRDINAVTGEGLVDLTFAAAAVSTDSIPDDDLDELMIAADDGYGLGALASEIATADKDCIPDDGLDEVMVAAGGTGDLMMTCDMELDSELHVRTKVPSLSACKSDGSVPEDCVLYFVAGYIAFKLKKFTKCAQCLDSIVNRSGTKCDQARLVLLRTRGGLQFPSSKLLMLLLLAERCLQKRAVTVSAQLYRDTTDDVSNSDVQSCMIGCGIHCCTFTSRAVHHYVLTRLHFLNRSRNRNLASRREKHKLTKVSKLT